MGSLWWLPIWFPWYWLSHLSAHSWTNLCTNAHVPLLLSYNHLCFRRWTVSWSTCFKKPTHVTPTIRNCLVIMRILRIWRKTERLIHHICVACTTAKMLQCLPTNEVSTIVSHHYDDVLKRRFHMIPHAFGHTKFTFGKLWTRLFCWNFEVKKWNLLFTVLFTIHFYYSWHCSFRIFTYLRGVIP